MKFCISLFLLLLSYSFVCGQDSYSEKEKASFVKVYFESKKEKVDQDAILPILSKYNVDPKRYGEIIRQKLEMTDRNLSSSEKQLLVEIKQVQENNQFKKRDYTKIVCEEQNLSHTTYLEILDAYKTDIKFQRSMKPFFDAYIKSLK